MSQRSQIYISYKNGKNENVLIARYFGWNFGSRMVSRAAGIIGWITETVKSSPYKVSDVCRCTNFVEKLSKVCDVNFDFRDIVISQDIVEEAKEYQEYHCESPEDYIFNYNSCDGKLFVQISDDNIIRYAFTDDETSKPMTAEEYMAWGEYDTEIQFSNYDDNRKAIAEQAQLMPADELDAFLSARYANVKAIKEKQTEEPEPNFWVTFRVDDILRREYFDMKITEEDINEARKESRAEGRDEKETEFILRKSRKGQTAEFIADDLDIPIEKVRRIIEVHQ